MENGNDAMCEVHGDQRVIGSCSSCGRPLCNKCLGERKGERLLCQECSIENILASYDDERERETEETAATEVKKQEHVQKRRKALRISLVCALAVEGVLVFFLAGKVAPKAHHWLVGGMDEAYAESLQVEKCVGNLWRLKAAIDKFTHENRRPPATLSEMLDNQLDKLPVCPASRQEYVYEQVKDGVYVFRCPTPQEHAVRELRCDTTGCAPQAIP